MDAGESIDPRDILTARAVRVSLDPAHPDPRILLSAASIIRQGGIVAHPTETWYGLATDPFSQRAVEALGRLKGRVAPRALILLISRAEEAFDLAQAPGVLRGWYERLSRSFWPGPLTIVLPVRPRLRVPALAGGDTVAVRVSSHPVARLLVSTTGRPITSTSANPTGAPEAASAEAIDPRLSARLDLVIDGGPAPGGAASTILDLTGARPAVIRAGPITPERIGAVLGFMPRVATAA